VQSPGCADDHFLHTHPDPGPQSASVLQCTIPQKCGLSP
jgi:hypothetical protein